MSDEMSIASERANIRSQQIIPMTVTGGEATISGYRTVFILHNLGEIYPGDLIHNPESGEYMFITEVAENGGDS
ncbi:MAG: hypothetical protein GF364_22635 [Candidatus Lokiarchaeota archaeon]|nr:hypothetical protein [Candidatus Lokiarchaeota archaeon]